jgi:hypothetical protein
LVSESAGIVVTADGGQPATVMAFTFAAGKITEIYILTDRSQPGRATHSADRRQRAKDGGDHNSRRTLSWFVWPGVTDAVVLRAAPGRTAPRSVRE